MLAKGRWIAERPSQKMHRGYHINALYAPTGLGLGWRQIAEKWLKSQNDTSELKAFINTYLGEVFKEQGEEVESAPLMMRREVYSEVYKNAKPWLIETAGVDVQKDRIEISFVGWGVGEEAWLIDHVIIAGDTAQADVWEELAEVFNQHPVKKAMIDYGYNSSMVAEFVRPRAYTVAGKGFAGTGRPLVEDEKRRKQRLRTKRKKGVPVEPLGVDQGKAIIYSRLKQTEPGAGYIHFPQESAFDDEYFAQLTAEKLVERRKGMRTFYEWVQTRPRNEALDCFNYALAALKMLDIDWTTQIYKTSAPAKPVKTSAPSQFAINKPKKPNPFLKDD
jgi:phage terminase large subunit GpA-like protein